MLYRAYSNPMDWVSMSINRGRFGTFVEGFLKAEYKRRKEEVERNEDWMLWVAYIHSYSDKSFNDWKKQFVGGKSTTAKASSDADLDEDAASKIIDSLFGG